MPAHANRGNYDEIILRHLDEYSKYKQLKRLELEMDPDRERPAVRMEEGMKERDYPETRKYDYVPHNTGKEYKRDVKPKNDGEKELPPRRRRTQKI